MGDLTGEPDVPVDRDTAEALGTIPGVRVAVHHYGPDDVPQVRRRSLEELVAWARVANEHRDQNRMSLAGREVGTLLTELRVHALTGAGSGDRYRRGTYGVKGVMIGGYHGGG